MCVHAQSSWGKSKDTERLRRSGFTAPLRQAGKEALPAIDSCGKRMGCFQRDPKIYYRLVKCQISTVSLMKWLIDWFLKKGNVSAFCLQFSMSCCNCLILTQMLLSPTTVQESNCRVSLWSSVANGRLRLWRSYHYSTVLSLYWKPKLLDHMRSQAVSQKHLSSCHPFFTSFTAQLYCTLSIHECLEILGQQSDLNPRGFGTRQ